jgi:hypothetical protein
LRGAGEPRGSRAIAPMNGRRVQGHANVKRFTFSQGNNYSLFHVDCLPL